MYGRDSWYQSKAEDFDKKFCRKLDEVTMEIKVLAGEGSWFHIQVEQELVRFCRELGEAGGWSILDHKEGSN